MLRPPSSVPPTSSNPTDEEVCRHVAEVCAELRQLTRRPRLRTVHYLLDMARLEAERTAQTPPGQG